MPALHRGPFGFGLMRLPKNGEVIDVRQVSQMVDRFLAAGLHLL